MEFQVRHLSLYLLFSVIRAFWWFWMRSLHNNIQLILGFLKGAFLAAHFTYYTVMTFLKIQVFAVSVIRHLICGFQNWVLYLNLIYETLWTVRGRGLLISVLEKLNWFYLTGLITLMLLMSKWIGPFLRKNQLLRCWALLSLQIGLRPLHYLYIAKNASKKIGTLSSVKFLSPEADLYLSPEVDLQTQFKKNFPRIVVIQTSFNFSTEILTELF